MDRQQDSVESSPTTSSSTTWIRNRETEAGSHFSWRSLTPNESCSSKASSIRRPSSCLPEVVNFAANNDKEVSFADEKQVAGACEKQVVQEEQLPEALDDEGGKEFVTGHDQSPSQEIPAERTLLLNRIVWDRRAKLSMAAILLILLVAIGLGVGLGLGLQSNSPSGSMTPPQASMQMIGGALNSAYYSTTGAFNGTGMAITQQSFADRGTVVFYFQHWTGQIRYMQLTDSGEWVGGNAASIVATDAKNNTPISTVSYVLNNGSQASSQWHVYYIDQQNMIRERYNTNDTNIWQDGVLNDLNATAMAAEQAGLLSCWVGDTAELDVGANASDTVGLRLLYASNSTTFQQLGWRHSYNAWEYEQSWVGVNGYTSPGCFSWGQGTTTYTMFTDLYGSVNVYWEDAAWNTLATPKHPINEWVNSSISIPDVGGAAELSYTNSLYAQNQDDYMIRGYNISWAAENSTVPPGNTFVVGSDPGLPGTRLTATELPGEDGSNQLVVFFQTNGSDITQYTRDVEGGSWKQAPLPIPHD